MPNDVAHYVSLFPSSIQERYLQLVALLESNDIYIEPYLWAGVPTFQTSNRYVRFILFKDHININTSLGISILELKPPYKVTPKGMVQLFVDDPIDEAFIKKMFCTVFFIEENKKCL
jgi:hypothetical protein